MVSIVELNPDHESVSEDNDLGFRWINLSHPNNVKTAKNRHIIHQHSMKNVGKSRRKEVKRKKIEQVQLDLSALDQKGQLAELGIHEMLTRPSWFLGTPSGTDPFIRYPVAMEPAAQELLAVVFQDDGGLQRPLRDTWFAVGLADDAAFFQVLSNSALHLDTMRNGGRRPKESALSLYYQLRAVKSVNDRRRENDDFISDGSMGAVSGFMAHDDIIGAFDRWNTHRDGLRDMISLRGGIESIEDNETLRVCLSWVELRGIFQQDIEPILPLPRQWLESAIVPTLPYGNLVHARNLRRIWVEQMPGQLEWLRMYECLVLFSMDTFPVPTGSATLEHQHPHTGAWTNPMVHQLLSFRPLLQFGISTKSLIQEASRLGALLYLAPVWRMFGVHPVRSEAFIYNLKHLLATHKIEWSRLWELQLWVLFMGAMEAQLVDDARLFVKEIANILYEHEVYSWDGGLTSIKQILWVETIFGGKDTDLGREVDALIEQRLCSTVSSLISLNVQI